MNANMTHRAGATLAVVLTCLAFATTGWCQIQGTVVRKNGAQVSGAITYVAAARTYNIVTLTATGSPITQKVPKDDVSEVKVPEPKELAGLVQAVQAGRYAEAIPGLSRIVSTYEGMNYDEMAAGPLARAYLKSNQPKKTIEIVEKIMQGSGGTVDTTKEYCDALLATEQYAKLKIVLRDMAGQGNPDVAAMALLKRGHMEMKQGNPRDALIGGFLRVVVLYQNVKELQPEALYYAHKCFEQLNQVSHSERMKNKLLAEFSNDPYAQKVKGGGS